MRRVLALILLLAVVGERVVQGVRDPSLLREQQEEGEQQRYGGTIESHGADNLIIERVASQGRHRPRRGGIATHFAVCRPR